MCTMPVGTTAAGLPETGATYCGSKEQRVGRPGNMETATATTQLEATGLISGSLAWTQGCYQQVWYVIPLVPQQK